MYIYIFTSNKKFFITCNNIISIFTVNKLMILINNY